MTQVGDSCSGLHFLAADAPALVGPGRALNNPQQAHNSVDPGWAQWQLVLCEQLDLALPISTLAVGLTPALKAWLSMRCGALHWLIAFCGYNEDADFQST